MRAQRHEILGGKVQLFRRGSTWYASASYKGYQYKKSTGEDSLELAKEVAEDWYMGLRGKARAGLPLRPEKPVEEPTGPTFNDVADLFEAEYEVSTEGQRSPKWVRGHKDRLRLHLRPFFGDTPISKINSAMVQAYRVHRSKEFGRVPPKDKEGNYIRPLRPPSVSTIHDEIGTLSLVLQTAERHEMISGIPNLKPPYRALKKVFHRPWFSKEEYIRLYTATGKAMKAAPAKFRWCYEQLHDLVLFLANTGLRPDEAKQLQHRDVQIVLDEDTNEEILEIDVRGKTGYGPCKSMPGAVEPYRRLLARAKPRNEGRQTDRARYHKLSTMLSDRGVLSPKNQKRLEVLAEQFDENAALAPPEYPKPTDLVFPSNHTDLFNDILEDIGLKYDRDNQPRVLYSLRHTYICLRLLDGAHIYQVAKNCRTSVEMIEKHYARHLKTMIDASMLNVRKPTRPQKKAAEPAPEPA